MPIALRLNMADSAFPTSQWTEAGATRIAPRVSLTRPAFSGCSPNTARIAEVSITISTWVLYNLYNCTTTILELALIRECRPLRAWQGAGEGASYAAGFCTNHFHHRLTMKSHFMHHFGVY